MKSYRYIKCKGIFILVACTITGLILTGCGTTNTAALQNAKSVYSQAQANPTVAENAPVTLREAGQTLQKAEKAENETEQSHLAYIAEAQTRQAVAEAQEKAAKDEVAQLDEQRNQIVIQSRERQVAQAQRQAEMNRQRAQMSQQRAEQARREAMELRQQLQGLQAKETDRGVVLTLSDVYFKVDRADLQPGASLNLARLADFLRKHPDQKVLIEGHADSTGTAVYNMELSQQRANSVREMLIANGVNPNQITAKGYGEGFPVASNANTAGRQQNRRVDIVVLPSTA